MNRIVMFSLSCLIAILIIMLSVFLIDYTFMNSPEKICGLKDVKDITENESSSYVEKLVECYRITVREEEQIEKEDCKEIVEDFEFKCTTQEKPLDKDEEITDKEENTADKNEVTNDEKENTTDKNEVTNDEEENAIDKNEISNSSEVKPEPEVSKKWGVQIGDYNGLTYYSQIDDRWKDTLYTSTGNPKQTIGSSGCGPAAVSIVVSSIKGDVTPAQIAGAFQKNGYRSPNNGTYWSAFRATAEEFDINYVETSNFEKALDLLRNNYYVIVSCGNGLFTTGGHYVVLVGIESNTLEIYDPYLYNGKFNTASRRGKVVVEGNTIFCSVENFKRYSAYKGFFCYNAEN